MICKKVKYAQKEYLKQFYHVDDEQEQVVQLTHDVQPPGVITRKSLVILVEPTLDTNVNIMNPPFKKYSL